MLEHHVSHFLYRFKRLVVLSFAARNPKHLKLRTLRQNDNKNISIESAPPNKFKLKY